ncbi:MAG: hypothetical protein LBE80_06840 [Deltaproteobacteria bacterium]|nr:hypothetical protein [Deltaproteobacteria bacterium]
MSKRNLIKLFILIPALLFLVWWGWSGNFAFNRASLFTLFDQESFYTMEVGRSSMGLARRTVKLDPKNNLTTLSEASVLNLTFSGLPIKIKTESEIVFDQEGRLVSADFSLPMGPLSGQAQATVDGQTLKMELSLAGKTHAAQAPMPPTGPVLVSGLIPWLAHQRNIPMGRPIGLSLLDPLSMTFKPAQLTIEDVTEMVDELQVFKVSLTFMGSENSEWIDSQGKLLRQFNPGLEIGLVAVRDNQVEQIRPQLEKALAEPVSIPEGPLASMIGGFISNDGLEVLSKVISQGGEASPWTLVQEPDPVPGEDSGEVSGETAKEAPAVDSDELSAGSQAPSPEAAQAGSDEPKAPALLGTN